MTTLRTKRAVSALAALTLAVGGIGTVEIFSEVAAPPLMPQPVRRPQPISRLA